jgi:hypothetical protein
LAQSLELNGLAEIGAEAGVNAAVQHVANHVGRQRNDGHVRDAEPLLPLPDFLACLVAVLVGHLEITLFIFT